MRLSDGLADSLTDMAFWKSQAPLRPGLYALIIASDSLSRQSASTASTTPLVMRFCGKNKPKTVHHTRMRVSLALAGDTGEGTQVGLGSGTCKRQDRTHSRTEESQKDKRAGTLSTFFPLMVTCETQRQ
eukprot:179245-Pyramimonas_sp.AAC.2